MTSASANRSSRRRRGGLAALVLGLGVVVAPLHAAAGSICERRERATRGAVAPTAIEPTTSTTSTPSVLETTTSAIGAPGPAVKRAGSTSVGSPSPSFSIWAATVCSTN